MGAAGRAGGTGSGSGNATASRSRQGNPHRGEARGRAAGRHWQPPAQRRPRQVGGLPTDKHTARPSISLLTDAVLAPIHAERDTESCDLASTSSVTHEQTYTAN